MKSLTFNKDSWHFLLAYNLAGYRPFDCATGDNDCGDICTYSKHVMSGLVILALAGILIALIGFVVAHILFGIWFSIMLGTWFFSDLAMFAMLLTGVLGILSAIIIFEESSTYHNRFDSFVTHAYKSWKEKFCVNINFVDKHVHSKDSSDDF